MLTAFIVILTAARGDRARATAHQPMPRGCAPPMAAEGKQSTLDAPHVHWLAAVEFRVDFSGVCLSCRIRQSKYHEYGAKCTFLMISPSFRSKFDF